MIVTKAPASKTEKKIQRTNTEVNLNNDLAFLKGLDSVK